MMVDIIGAGIGGLTTAIALDQGGIECRLFEQASVMKPIGAGIILANNAMQVYERLGLRGQIEAGGNPISLIRIANAQLNTISEVNLRFFEAKHGVKNIAISRGVLQEILLRHVPAKSLYLEHQLAHIKRVQAGFDLQFRNKTKVNSSILLGADGLHSTVRNSLFDQSTIRVTQQLCWRGVTDMPLPKRYQNELNEAWGRGDRFGFVQIAPNKVYWYALKSFKKSQDEYSVAELNHYFRDYHPIVTELIHMTPLATIHTSVISDLKPIKHWYRENVCLIGDAAHATTPNMGQGACQGIEDALVISACLKNYEINEAFAQYQKLRMSKAQRVVNNSWTLGQLAHWKNPVARGLRNQMMRLAPERMNRKQSELIFELNRV